MNSLEQQRDLDETRRLAVMAKVALMANRPISVDLAGTLVHAMAYHTNLASPKWCEAIGKELLHGNPEIKGHLDTVIEKLNELLA